MKKNVLFYKASYFVLWLIALAVLEACTGFIRAIEGGPKMDNIVMLLKYFVLTLVVLRKWKRSSVPIF
jgi:hypothetical protein